MLGWALVACTGGEGGAHAGGGSGGVGGGDLASGSGGVGGGVSQAGSGGKASSAGSAGMVSGGSGMAGSGVELPAGALELGPYPLSGSVSGGGTWTFWLTMDADGDAWFAATGSMMLGEKMPVVTGMLRAPSASAIGGDWLCPGTDATWVPTASDDTPDCSAGATRCEYALIMPAPTRLACGAAGTGDLTFAPVAQNEMSAAASSLTEFDGLAMQLGTHVGLSLNPAQTYSPTFVQFSSGAGPETMRTILLFDSTPVAAPAGTPVTEWTLSNPFVLRRTGATGETTLYCAASGTYRISSTEPIQHSVELVGVGEALHCPGAPPDQPLVVRID